MHEWPVVLPYDSMKFFAHAAFFPLRARSTNHNDWVGIAVAIGPIPINGSFGFRHLVPPTHRLRQTDTTTLWIVSLRLMRLIGSG
jgi:hypothetical protein